MTEEEVTCSLTIPDEYLHWDWVERVGCMSCSRPLCKRRRSEQDPCLRYKDGSVRCQRGEGKVDG